MQEHLIPQETRDRLAAQGVVLASPAEVLRTKLSIWETRAKHAKGARKAECEAAVADLRAKLHAVHEEA